VRFEYSNIKPIDSAIPASRQKAKRHYGVHPYFTRRPPNVVRHYIQWYTREGDRVLDPFGGSGVTAIEALLSNRIGIHNDINPLGNFIAQQIADVSQPSADHIRRAFSKLEASCGDLIRDIYRISEGQVEYRLRQTKLPENIQLPSNSDVPRFFDLFTRRQLLALATLKNEIDDIHDKKARAQLLLAWSATLTKLNRTFLSAKGRLESRGGSSIFSIYRYKVAKAPVELDPWETFAERVSNVIKAKEEVLLEKRYLEEKGNWQGRFEVHAVDIGDLAEEIQPVDYIFTDPPYGGHIAYLDLSTLWNHWLGFEVSSELRKKEIIVGGELDIPEEKYVKRLGESIGACFRLLKKDRWISIVFQHWNTSYFEAILEAAEEGGGSLRAAVTQVGDTIWSMHKKKNRERVLAGEMILTFLKDEKLRRRKDPRHILEIEGLVDIVVPAVVSAKGELHSELLFNRLITEAWQRNALHALRIRREDFVDLLQRRGWHYNTQSHSWRRGQSETAKQGALVFH